MSSRFLLCPAAGPAARMMEQSGLTCGCCLTSAVRFSKHSNFIFIICPVFGVHYSLWNCTGKPATLECHLRMCCNDLCHKLPEASQPWLFLFLQVLWTFEDIFWIDLSFSISYSIHSAKNVVQIVILWCKSGECRCGYDHRKDE